MSQPKRDAADALAAAERTAGTPPSQSPQAPPPASHEDALKAMADGQDLWEEAGKYPHELTPEQAAAATAQPLPAKNPPPPVDLGAAPQRRATAAQMQSRLQRAHAHSFKKTMAPLLVVVGLLVMLLAGLVAVMDALDLLRDDGGGMFGGPVRTVMIILAFPLGAILLVGAWLFHRDVSQAGK